MYKQALFSVLLLGCSPTTNNFSLQSEQEDAAPEGDGGLPSDARDGASSSVEDGGAPATDPDGSLPASDGGSIDESDAGLDTPDSGDTEPPIAPCVTGSDSPLAGTWSPDFSKDRAVLRFDFGGGYWMVQGAGCDLEISSMTVLNRFLVDDYTLQYVLLLCDSTPMIQATPVDKCLLHDVESFDVEVVYRKI